MIKFFLRGVIMFKFVCVFLPEIFSIQGETKNKDLKEIVVKYLKNVLIVNFIMMIFLSLTHRDGYLTIEGAISAQFAMKYIALALVISLVLPTFEKIIKENLKLYFRLEPKNNGKKDKKKKNN